MTDIADAVVLSPSNVSLVEELRSTREFIKKLKAREDEIRSILLTELKDAEFGVTASGVPMVGVERYSRTRVDSKRLQALYPDTWDDCQIETSVEVLKLPETLED